jgi:hypothetical protein
MWHHVVRRSFLTCRIGAAPVFRVNYPTTLRHIHSHHHVNLISHDLHVNSITAVAWSHVQLYPQPCARSEGVCGYGCVDHRIFSFCTRWRWVVAFTQWPLNLREGSGYSLPRRPGGPHSRSWRLEEKISSRYRKPNDDFSDVRPAVQSLYRRSLNIRPPLWCSHGVERHVSVASFSEEVFLLHV